MTNLESRIFLIAYIVSNVMAMIMLIAAIKWPRAARLLFFILFAWACWVNWRTALDSPQLYLEYERSSFLDIYKQFINGWFSQHILLSVGFIATCQGLIACAMLLKGVLFKIGCIGGMVFLVAILPLGFYAAFPCTLVMAIAFYFMIKKNADFIWVKPKQKLVASN